MRQPVQEGPFYLVLILTGKMTGGRDATHFELFEGLRRLGHVVNETFTLSK